MRPWKSQHARPDHPAVARQQEIRRALQFDLVKLENRRLAHDDRGRAILAGRDPAGNEHDLARTNPAAVFAGAASCRENRGIEPLGTPP
jgi:hypothetical protein